MWFEADETRGGMQSKCHCRGRCRIGCVFVLVGALILGIVMFARNSDSAVPPTRSPLMPVEEKGSEPAPSQSEQPMVATDEPLPLFPIIPKKSKWVAETNRLMKTMTTVTYKCTDKRTIGGMPNGDGQWTVCFDKLKGILGRKEPCVVYSIGSANDFTFDDKMHDLGCEVHTFDPTVGWSVHKTQRRERAWKYGIGFAGAPAENRPSVAMFRRRRQQWTVKSVADVMRENGHNKIDVFKMDVEGNEWEVFRSFLTSPALLNVDQLLFEVHFWARGFEGHYRHSHTLTNKFFQIMKSILQHFDLFHYHINPMSTFELMPRRMRCCTELSMVLKPRMEQRRVALPPVHKPVAAP